jgi:hypothetical protein
MALGRGLDLSVAIIAVQIGKNSASPVLQIGPHVFRNSLQLFRPPFFCRPGLRLFDPGIELKMRVSIHGFDVLGEGSHLSQRRVLRGRILAVFLVHRDRCEQEPSCPETSLPLVENIRRGRESNPRIEVLQTSALPLGYPAGERIGSIALNFTVSTWMLAIRSEENSREKAQKARKGMPTATGIPFDK